MTSIHQQAAAIAAPQNEGIEIGRPAITMGGNSLTSKNATRLLNVVNDACESAYQEFLNDPTSPLHQDDVNWGDLGCVQVDAENQVVWIEEVAENAVNFQEYVRNFVADRLGEKYASLKVVTDW